jgi:ubiquinone biosynthesis monooxygenase Coq7
MNHRRLKLDGDGEIATRIANYEMAYRLQSSAPELMDLSGEDKATLEMYGCDPKVPSFARACLLARRMAERGVRPTALYPIWNAAGFALGAVSAAISPEAAMACTVAIETEIDRHYSEQLEEIGDSDPELSAMIADFQADELEHKATALAEGAERALAYPVMSVLVRLGCRTAIAVSKHI